MDVDDARPATAARPNSLKKLRACKTCKLVKTWEQFHSGFCENCPHKRPDSDHVTVRDDFVAQETTADFEGMVSLMQPGTSWVSRWLRMRYTDEDGHTVAFLPGVYAISLPGEEAMAASGAGRRGAGGDEDEYEDDEEEAEDEGEEEDADDDVGGSSSSSGKKGAAASKGGKGKGGRGAGAGAGSSSSSSSSSSAAAAAEAPSSGPSLFRPAGARAAAPVAPDRDDPDALDAAVHAATVPQDERDDE